MEETTKYKFIQKNLFDVEYWSLEMLKLKKLKFSRNVVAITGGFGAMLNL